MLISIEIIPLRLLTENIHVIRSPIKRILIEPSFLISQAFDSNRTIQLIIHAPIDSCSTFLADNRTHRRAFRY